MGKDGETVLTIAGSDPSGGAGAQADLEVFHSLNLKGISALTALTAQNEERFFSVNPVTSTLLREQLRSVVHLYKPKAAKIGMLGTEENVFAVYRFFEEFKIPAVVLDPVFRSSTGAILLEPKGIAIVRQFLTPRVTVITPNLDEAEALCNFKVRNLEQMKEAAHQIFFACRGVQGVIVKGGHLTDEATDILYDGHDWHLFRSKIRFPTKVHGTGCVYSAALTAYLAKDQSLEKAAKLAKDYVTQWIHRRLESAG